MLLFVARQRKRRRAARENQYQRPVELNNDDLGSSGKPKYGSNNGTHLAQLADAPMLATTEIDGASRHEIDRESRHGRQVNGLR